MESGYFGGILDRDAARMRPPEASWEWTNRDVDVFLHAAGPSGRLFKFGPRALLFRGPIVDTTSRQPRDT